MTKKEIKKSVEKNAKTLDKIVANIVNGYCKDLDECMEDIKESLNKKPHTEKLERYCMELSTHIYFASSMCENLGIRDDISKAVYKEAYHVNREEAKGTVEDKNSYAELRSQNEYVINVCYNRAYKILKAKVESAQEVLSSCKKIISRRMQEYELTRLSQ